MGWQLSGKLLPLEADREGPSSLPAGDPHPDRHSVAEYPEVHEPARWDAPPAPHMPEDGGRGSAETGLGLRVQGTILREGERQAAGRREVIALKSQGYPTTCFLYT